MEQEEKVKVCDLEEESYELQGLSGEALQLALELGEHQCHTSRVMAILKAIAAPQVGEEEYAHWGIRQWRLLSELNGSGGLHNMGGENHRSSKYALVMGSQAADEAAWKAAWTVAFKEAIGPNPITLVFWEAKKDLQNSGPWLSIGQESPWLKEGKNDAVLFFDEPGTESGISLLRRIFAERMRSDGDCFNLSIEGVNLQVEGSLLSIGQALNLAVKTAKKINKVQ